MTAGRKSSAGTRGSQRGRTRGGLTVLGAGGCCSWGIGPDRGRLIPRLPPPRKPVDCRRRPAVPEARAMEAAEYGLMDAAEDRMWWYRALHARLLRAIEGAEGPLLDAGCGTGGFLARVPAGLA